MQKCQNPTIAIIDSGIGGVSILQQLIAKYNAGNFIYFADNLYMPYGNKDKSWLKERIKTLISLLQTKYNVDYIVIACNTASTVVPEEEFENLKTMRFIPNYTYFATNLTKKNLSNFNVIADCSLAKQIEKHIFDKKKMQTIIKRHIKLHRLNEQQEIVLGCTHYELVKDIIQKYCPNTMIFNNSQFVINNINLNIKINELNVVIMLSKNNSELENKIFKLIRR